MKNNNPGHKITSISINAYRGDIFIAISRGSYKNEDGDQASNITTHTWLMSPASVMRATRAALVLRDMQKVTK